MAIRITEARIRKLGKGIHPTGHKNLYLRVFDTGRKSWTVRVQRQGTIRWHTLGAWPDVTIAQAVGKAGTLVDTRHGRARTNVADAVESFLAVQIRPHYRRTASPEVYGRAIVRAIGPLAVDTVRPLDVSTMVSAYARKAPVASMRLLTFTKLFFRWCVSMGYVERSPTADIDSKSFGVVEVARDRTLTGKEIKKFWHADDLPHRALLRALLVSGCRITEMQRATNARLDKDWLDIPGADTKNAKPHKVFVTPTMRQQFAARGPLLFASVSPTAVQSALRRWCIRNGQTPWTPHDLRRTFATLAGEAGVFPHVVAKCLNHTIEASASINTYFRAELFPERKAATVIVEKVVKAAIKLR